MPMITILTAIRASFQYIVVGAARLMVIALGRGGGGRRPSWGRVSPSIL